METYLSVAALGLAVAAVLVAWRARVIAISARRRLREAEARGFEPEPAPFAPSRAPLGEGSLAHEVADTLRRRVEALEARLDQEAPAAAVTSPRLDGVEGLVREQLRRQGWEPTSVSAIDGEPGSFAVEAIRAGVVAKGTAVVGADRHVTVRLSQALRAFP